ncbi:AraC family transcriptional regulator [Pediococcus cellicola]|uniref:AraC family transcriptional regulator n=1 Tax=Pediococcus cellicola TaxID=319652 RepID=A0A0R2IJ26_9LACO|nr:AraC family transcriptional regulator [Pediococcus cellicola]KRN65011.1 AraC family transcriptional regulator [Pediococcus cellicola]GEL15905.1 AraC family transcriptional regulator [Pediococcus cellicola]
MYQHEKIDIDNSDVPVKFIVQSANTQNILRHWHQALEIDMTIQGKADFIISGKRVQENPNNVIIVNTDEIHAVTNIQNTSNVIALTFLFPYQFLKREIPNYDYYWFRIANANSDESKQKIEQLRRVLIHFYRLQNSTLRPEQRRLAQMNDIFSILKELTINFSEIKSETSNLSITTNLRILSQVLDYMGKYYKEKLYLSTIANKFHLSVGYLSRLFKGQMGMSVMAYLREFRLQQAFRILTNTEKKENEIADSVGFPNSKSFRMAFKRKYGLTPIKYRQNIKRSKNGL